MATSFSRLAIILNVTRNIIANPVLFGQKRTLAKSLVWLFLRQFRDSYACYATSTGPRLCRFIKYKFGSRDSKILELPSVSRYFMFYCQNMRLFFRAREANCDIRMGCVIHTWLSGLISTSGIIFRY